MTKLKIVSLMMGSLCVLSACIGAGQISAIKDFKDGYFPSLRGIDLHGQERVIPQDFTNDFNLIAVAFEREQQEDVNTWIEVADNIMQERDDVSFYEIPLIYEMGAFNRSIVNNGMRSGIEDEIARKRTVTVYTDRDQFLDLMDMQSDRIYVLLLDRDGKILWRESGVVNKQFVSDLNGFLSEKQ